MPGEGPIFVSYAREDEDIARALKDRLSEQGIQCAMDTGIIEAGDDWRAKVLKLIDRAAAVVVVCTSRSVGSQEVTSEWAYAMGVGIPVIPIVYKSGLKLPTALAGLDRLDFTSVAKRPWEKLVSRVREVLGESKVTSLAVRSIGVEKIFTSRHDFLKTYSLKTTLSVARDSSELLVVGRSLEAWAREFHLLRSAIVTKGLHVKMAVVNPNLPPRRLDGTWRLRKSRCRFSRRQVQEDPTER